MFSQLIGNISAKDFLGRLLTASRVPNALLFAGPEGVGKKQFAFELARSFVCSESKDDESCSRCSACQRVGIFDLPTSEKGDDYDEVFYSHSDVGLVIPYKRNLRVGAIRELEREANFLPYEARARIFIIDDADKMNDAASNALLKTLEEPPPTSHIILISSRPDSLLQTILSRCQVIRFAPVDAIEIQDFLTASEKLAPEDAELAARLSSGSVGRAVSMNVETFRVRRHLMLGVLQNAILRNDRAALLRTAEELSDAKNKDDFEDTLGILQTLIHDVWTIKLQTGLEKLVNSDVLAELQSLAEVANTSTLASWLDEIELVRENMLVNINKKIAADALFMKMTA